jgi:hypothetical protein
MDRLITYRSDSHPDLDQALALAKVRRYTKCKYRHVRADRSGSVLTQRTGRGCTRA